jgi:hypothetical protein
MIDELPETRHSVRALDLSVLDPSTSNLIGFANRRCGNA